MAEQEHAETNNIISKGRRGSSLEHVVNYGSIEQSQTSYFSVNDANGKHDFVLERAMRLADVLEKSAKQLRTHVKVFDKQDKPPKRIRKPRIPRRITENLLPITALWQVLCVTVLSVVDAFDKKIETQKNAIYLIGIAILFVFQFANLILVVSASVKLTKQYLHKTASMSFLLQAYFSSIVLFAGLYMVIYRIQPSTFEHVKLDGKKKHTLAVVIFVKMLFLSISTGTLCGAANITADEWYSQLAMAFQMLLSFIYFASILSQVINPRLTPATREKPEKSDTGDQSYGIV